MNTWIVSVLYLACGLFAAAGLICGVRYAWQIHDHGYLVRPPRLLIAAFVGVVLTLAAAGFLEAAAA